MWLGVGYLGCCEVWVVFGVLLWVGVDDIGKDVWNELRGYILLCVVVWLEVWLYESFFGCCLSFWCCDVCIWCVKVVMSWYFFWCVLGVGWVFVFLWVWLDGSSLEDGGKDVVVWCLRFWLRDFEDIFMCFFVFWWGV